VPRDRDIALRPKSFEVLRYLLENTNRVVTKHELMKAIWPNIIVTDQVLTHCVAEVRQAIGDGDQAIIKTIPRRGYRFAAPVVRVAAGAVTPAFPSRVAAPPASPDSSPLSDRPSVAVLPFANLSGDPQQDYFSDGMTEDIITELSLLVIARNSTFQYKGKAVDVRQVGRELGTLYILEGSVRRSGDRIRIAAQLIDAVTGAHRWAERYDRELHDAFAVQDEMARTIVATLATHVNRAETERALLKPPAAWEAYEYYLRGAEAFFLLRTRRTKALLYEARRLLEQSLAIDPAYARAAAMLAGTRLHAYIEPFDGDYLNPAALDRALELAETAVHLDPLLPQARAQLGFVLVYKGQHDAALAEFERAFALNPNFIDHRYAQALMYAGEPARAIEVLELNIRLDPFQPSPFQLMGLAHYMLKRYGEAVVGCAKAHRACPVRSCPISSWRPPMRSPCNFRRRGRKPWRCSGSTLVSQLKAGNLFSPTRTPRTSSIASTGCARRGCRRLEPWLPLAHFPSLSTHIIKGRLLAALRWQLRVKIRRRVTCVATAGLA
jgi:adenylate cyclase